MVAVCRVVLLFQSLELVFHCMFLISLELFLLTDDI